MKHTLRCHDFGYEHTADRWVVEFRQSQEMGHGPKSRQPARGCGQDRRRAEAWSRGPGFRGCDRAGVHRTVGIGALMSRSGVASKHKPLGTCSALRGSFVARLANMANIGCTSLRAIDDFGSQRSRHYVRDSTLSERRRTVNGGPVSCRDADGARRIVMNSRSWTWVQTSLLWHQRWFRINAF